MDLVPEAIKCIEKIELLRQIICQQSMIDYKSQDARMVALDTIQNQLNSTGMWIQAFNSLANKCMRSSTVFDEEEFKTCVGSKLSLIDTEVIMFDSLRLGFVVLTHFKIDNLFRNILRDLNELPKQSGFWNLADKTLTIAALPLRGEEKEILTVYANIRNSLHGNGIHYNENLRKIINGLAFDFIKKQRVVCASWFHIIVALNSNIDVLSKILLSDRIKNITHEIIDDFASGK